MPPKRQSPLESNPPSASSSDEESEEGSESEEEEQPTPTEPIKPSTPKPPSDSDSSDEESEEEQEPKITNLAADEEDSESESESDSEPVKHMIAPRNPPVTAEVKPISSKPMSKKPASATPAMAAAGTKRSIEEEDEKNGKNRKKKKVSEIEDGEEEKKKVPFQRVFTPEDEIILLNSLIDYKKDGHNYATDMGGFLNFVKDSLKITVNKAQLQNKIQRLEKKFRNNAGRGKDGKDPVISKPHELKSYELSKVIWGDNGAEVTHLASAVGKRKKPQVKSNGVASPKKNVAKIMKSAKVEPVEEEEDEEDNEKEEDGAGGLEYPYLSQSMQNDPVLPQGLAGLVAKKGWDLMGASNAEALDTKWKSVLIAETKAYLQRIDVVREQTKLMLDVLESSDN